MLKTDAGRRQLQTEWNATAADYPREMCVQELFEAQVVRAPARTAVKDGTRSLTYRELEACAHRLAQTLAPTAAAARGKGAGLTRSTSGEYFCARQH